MHFMCSVYISHYHTKIVLIYPHFLHFDLKGGKFYFVDNGKDLISVSHDSLHGPRKYRNLLHLYWYERLDSLINSFWHSKPKILDKILWRRREIVFMHREADNKVRLRLLRKSRKGQRSSEETALFVGCLVLLSHCHRRKEDKCCVFNMGKAYIP